MKAIKTLLFAVTAFLIFSCGEESSSGKNSSKPKAKGSIGEIVLAIDSTKWAGPLGDELRDIFEADLPGMIRSEAMFKVHRVIQGQ